MNRKEHSILNVTVCRTDIESMLNYFDSGMADISTTNAVALAIGRQVRPELSVKVKRHARTETCLCHIAGVDAKLPASVFHWLLGVEHGRDADPFSFQLLVPTEFLRRPGKPESMTISAKLATTAA